MEMMRKIVIMLVLMILIPGGVLAQEEIDIDELMEMDLEEEVAVYHFPEIRPQASLSLGYRLVEQSGSEQAFEYEHLNDSPVFGGMLRVFRYPHRVYLETDVKNEKDYFGDIRYAFKDKVILRWVNKTLFHNLENITLMDTDPAQINITDPGVSYGIRTGINDVTLRLKPLDFPLHGYFRGFYVDTHGSRQQRSLIDFNVRTTEERDIDLKTRTYTGGINSHLGPVEADYFHTEKRFDAGGDRVLMDTVPHNQLSELDGSSDTVKIHTSYTGRLVASATFSLKQRDNKDSGADEDVFTGAGGLTWTPMPELAFFLKYSHHELDVSNPATATFNGIVFNISRDSVSTITDSVSVTGRFKPVSGITFRAEYSFKDIDRTNAGAWNLQRSTQKNALSLTADARVVRTVSVNANYAHRWINDPSYNTEPDYSDEGGVSVSWTPHPRVNALVSYSLLRQERDDLRFMETPDADHRDLRTDNIMGSGTVLLMKDLSLTASYAYMRYKLEQDIVYQMGGSFLVDPDVPYTDNVHVYSAGLDYMPEGALHLFAGITHTRGAADFDPASPDLLSPASVDSFSELKTRQTTVSLAGEYRFSRGLSCGLDYRYSDFNDVLDNVHNSEEDGDGHIILLTVSKRWE
jgi:hypothetical protein